MFTVYSKGYLTLKSLFFSTVTLFCVTICVKCMYTSIYIHVYTVYRYTSINLPHCLSCKWSCNKYFILISNALGIETIVSSLKKLLHETENSTESPSLLGITGYNSMTCGRQLPSEFKVHQSVKVFHKSGKCLTDSFEATNTDILYLLKEETEKSIRSTEVQLKQRDGLTPGINWQGFLDIPCPHLHLHPNETGPFLSI